MRTTKRRTTPVLRRAAAAGAAVLPTVFAVAASFGASGIWQNSIGDSNANWSSTGNWDSVPGAPDTSTSNTDTATFGSVSAGGLETPFLDTNRRLGHINIDNRGDDYNLTAAAGVTLVSVGHLTVTGSGGVTTISPKFTLAATTDQRWNTGDNDITFAGGVAFTNTHVLILVNTNAVKITGQVNATGANVLQFEGTGSAIISGNVVNVGVGNNTGIDSTAAYSGTIRLSGNNAFGGNITWRTGTLELASATAAGVAAGTTPNLSFGTTNGTPQASVLMTGAYTVSRSLLINTGAKNTSLTIGGTNTSGIAAYTGVFNLNSATVAALNLTASGGGTVDFAGAITSSASNMNKSGLGTVRFTNATGNTYSGRTSVAAGTLLVNNTSGSGTGTAVLQVGPNGTFGGSGSVGSATLAGGPVTVSGGGKLRAGTGATPGGSLTIYGDLTLQDNSRIQLVLDNSGNHSTLVRGATGTWTFDGDQQFEILPIGEVTPQFYNNVITGLAGDPGGTGTWTIVTPLFAGNFVYDAGSNAIDLTVTAAPEPASLSLLAIGGLGLLRRRRRS